MSDFMNLQILLHDEVQLVDWGESRAGGPWVKFRLDDPEKLAVFRGMDTAKANKTGHILNVTIAHGDIAQIVKTETGIPDKPAVKTGETGHWVAAIYRSGWFFNPKVLAALGTDEEYRAWIQRQRSCISGEFSEYVNGEGRSVAAHVRRAGESGTGFKAPCSCVPLTDAEHQKQHTQGESAFPGGAEWFDKQRAKYLQDWGHAQLRAALCVESLTDTTPEALRKWAHDHGIFSTLPLAVREI